MEEKSSRNTKLAKGQKKRLSRFLRDIVGIPARTICRTMKNSLIVEKITEHNKYGITRVKEFYPYGSPELFERTKNRLTQIVDCGMEEVGVAQFGVPGIMSGLYIEYVWEFSDEKWEDYMTWAKDLIKEKSVKK
jgi:hypothetical protein